MTYLTRTLNNILVTSAQDTDLGQSLVRTLLSLSVFIYLSVVYLSPSESVISGWSIWFVSLSYLLFSLFFIAWNVFYPGELPARRYLSLLVDTLVVSYALLAGGAIAAPLVGGYLWVTIANGLRFGRKYLYLTTVASLIGFAYVLFNSEYWQHNLPLGIGLFIWMNVLPLYVARMLKRLDMALKASQEASRAKSQFLANMGHELRTPLNAIIGYGEILLEDAELDRRKQDTHDLAKINTAAHLLLDMINDILDLSKLEAGRLEVHSEEILVDDILKNLQGAVSPLLEKNNNTFTVESKMDKTITLDVDGEKLLKILFNLISNAAKFTSDGSIILKVTQQIEEDDTKIMFQVIDNGIGISPDHCTQLFMPFVQADSSATRKYGGTGLGLVICKRFTELLGGQIRVDSQLGEGATFTLLIPQHSGSK